MDMGSTAVKFSGGKIVPHSVLRAGTTSGNPWQRLKHRDVFIGTWNVRTLYSSGALEIFDSFLRKGFFLFCFVHLVMLISLEIMRKSLHQ